MKAISIRQPWAYLVAAGIKRAEYRSRPMQYRGPLLILSTKKEPLPEDLREAKRLYKVKLPATFEIGGIVGLAELVDCVRGTDGSGSEISYDYVLRHARPVPFIPCRGQLGLYNIEGYDHLFEEYPPLIKAQPIITAHPNLTAHPTQNLLKKLRAQIAKAIEPK